MNRKIDLSNISFENRKLDEVLQEQLEKQKASAIEHQRRQEQARGMRIYGIKWGRAVKGSRGRSSKARVWSDHKIRKEYGLMKKPFPTQWQNILWLIGFEGPVTVAQISDRLDQSAQARSTISAAMSTFMKFLGPNNAYGKTLLIREKDPSQQFSYLYQAVLDASHPYSSLKEVALKDDDERKLWFDKASEQFIQARRIASRKAKQQKPKLEPEPEPIIVNQESPVLDAQGKTVEEVMKDVVNKAITDKPGPQEIADQRDREWQEEVAVAKENMQKSSKEALEQVLETFIVNKLEELNLAKTANLNINVTGKIKFRFGFGD